MHHIERTMYIYVPSMEYTHRERQNSHRSCLCQYLTAQVSAWLAPWKGGMPATHCGLATLKLSVYKAGWSAPSACVNTERQEFVYIHTNIACMGRSWVLLCYFMHNSAKVNNFYMEQTLQENRTHLKHNRHKTPVPVKLHHF